MILGEIVNNTQELDIKQFAVEHILSKLGMEFSDSEWTKDPAGNVVTGFGLWMRARDMIKFGQLYLNNGKWNGEQVIPKDWVEASTTVGPNLTFANRKHYGFQWWVGRHTVNQKEYHVYYAIGNGGNYIINIPALESVIVFHGAFWNDGSIHNTIETEVLDQLIIPALEEAF